MAKALTFSMEVDRAVMRATVIEGRRW